VVTRNVSDFEPMGVKLLNRGIVSLFHFKVGSCGRLALFGDLGLAAGLDGEFAVGYGRIELDVEVKAGPALTLALVEDLLELTARAGSTQMVTLGRACAHRGP